MKGQPLAYNKDNQEDKEPLFDTADTILMTLAIYADMLRGIEVNKANMRQAALEGFATATDLADYLVKKGMSFRDAHEAVALAVKHAVQKKCDLADLPLSDLQQFSQMIQDDAYAVLTLEGSLASRNHIGGTAPVQVKKAIERARLLLSQL
jgi:argininosuccinate lyase